MADDFAQVKKFVDQIGDVVSGAALGRVLDKAGAAGKKAALDAASKDLGGDRRFRNFKGKPPLNAGYDHAGGQEVLINFRPKGLWNLAQEGRKGHGAIYPRGVSAKGNSTKGNAKQFGKLGSFSAGQGHRAVKLPGGIYRAHSSYGSSRGLGTFDDAVRDAQTKVPDAANKQIAAEIRRVMNG